MPYFLLQYPASFKFETIITVHKYKGFPRPLFLNKISNHLLLHVVQDVFEVQIIVVVFNSFSYAVLKQGQRLEEVERGRNTDS